MVFSVSRVFGRVEGEVKGKILGKVIIEIFGIYKFSENLLLDLSV